LSQLIKSIKPHFEKIISPVLTIFEKFNISPNTLTILGLVITLIGTYFVFTKQFFTAGVILTIGAIFDAIDGALARKTKKTTKFGAFLDSTVDRIADFLPLFALAYHFKDDFVFFTITMLAILFSFLVSYTRARAEGLGLDCKVGIFERPERLVILIGALITEYLEIGVLVIFLGALWTTLERVIYVLKISSKLSIL
jgi:CDP-diacylglycerol--glycerol-3-phosphate 3-phosphatidyltransferase